MLNAYSLILFVPAFTFLAVGIYVLLQPADRASRALFMGVSICGAAWFTFEAFVYSANSPPQALYWARFLYTATSIMLAFIVHFSLCFLGRTKKYLIMIIPTYILAALFAVCALYSSYFISGVEKFYWGYFAQYGFVGYLYSVYTFVCVGFALLAFWREWQWAKNTKREEGIIKLTIFAYIASLFCGINHLISFGIEIYPIGYAPAVIYLIIFSYAIKTYGLRTIVPKTAADTVLRNINDPIVACNNKDRITFSNSVFESLVNKEDPEGHNVNSLLNINITKTKNNKAKEVTINNKHFEITAHSLTTTRGWLYVLHDITRQFELRNELEEFANNDQLTGLPNRRGLINNFNTINSKITILFIDIDKLKAVNETLGHEYGDKLIKESANRLQKIDGVRYLSRIGGDEFVLIINADQIQTIKKSITEQFDQSPFLLNGNTIYCSASAGVHSGYPEDEDFLNKASRAMKKAKKEPGTTFAHSTETKNKTGLKTGSRLREGIKNNEIKAYFQPIFDLENKTIVRSEALVRWAHPEKGVLTPGQFLSEAEEYGVITKLDFSVLETVTNKLHNNDITTPVHVNLSPHQFIQDEPDKLYNYFDCKEAKNIVVEVTETDLVTHNDNARKILNQLKQHGAKIALDDFGTGYSSISHLKQWPVDIIKIDKQLTKPLPEEGECFLEGLINFSHKLDKKVVIEGVETTKQAEALNGLGASYAQGYYFAHPKPLEEYINII